MSLMLVSNRLPITLEQEEGAWKVHAASGGLITALGPALKRWGGQWIGWPGASDVDPDTLRHLLDDFSQERGYGVASVSLTSDEYKHFYEGFCNQIIWPLFHDLQSFCNFKPEFWTSAVQVQEKFADAVMERVTDQDLVWVQDFHLLGLGKVLVDHGIRNKMAFFLHTPFPPPDIYCKLPWRKEVLKALLHYEVIGLQTPRDLRNFSDCLNAVLPDVEQRHTTRQSRMSFQGRPSVAGVFPIGIDYEEFAEGAKEIEVEHALADLRHSYPGQQIILAVDRLDYTKGIPQRLESFALALERYPDLRKKVTLFQVVVPSRESVPQYQSLKARIEQTVAQVNGKYTDPPWVPIHHVFRHVDRKELLTWYRAADVALVTSLKDGMNLVAKEYCACKVDGNGVLVLSEFAGASAQLGRWATLVNPYDSECVADAIKLAAVMTPAERRQSMEQLRANVRDRDVHWWINQFLKVCNMQTEQAKVA